MTIDFPSHRPAAGLLQRAGQIWFLVTAIGQATFIWFIAAHYWHKTLTGNFAGWNDKPIIKGYVEGDLAGNLVFAAHALMAAVMTGGGLLQLVPQVRARFPALHRWNGRLFLVMAFVLALGGLWLVWVRQTWLSIESTLPLSLNAILILLFGALAWQRAWMRRLAEHRRWAMRVFLVANGVWFLRVAMMAWVVLTGGGWGLTRDLSGPVDLALQFACYLLPLGMLELYWRAQVRGAAYQRVVAGALLMMTAVMGVGIFGTVAFMWGPYM